MTVGIVVASTGGEKTLRTLRTLAHMEPDFPLHVMIDVSSRTWNESDKSIITRLHQSTVQVAYTENSAHINGTLNAAMRWMKRLGYSHVCLLHDDLVFSPFPEHRGSLSAWFTPELCDPDISSGTTFAHLEAFVVDGNELYGRRPPAEWDRLDLSREDLWRDLLDFKLQNGYKIYPRDTDFYCHYEGPDIVRKWNRLGPTGQVLPISTWEAVGGFNETDFVHYDQYYPSECFRRGLPPVWAVTNTPWLHLHNQSMRPGGDPAPGMWGRGEAYIAKFGADWPGFWRDDWEFKWKGELPSAALSRMQSARP